MWTKSDLLSWPLFSHPCKRDHKTYFRMLEASNFLVLCSYRTGFHPILAANSLLNKELGSLGGCAREGKQDGPVRDRPEWNLRRRDLSKGLGTSLSTAYTQCGRCGTPCTISQVVCRQSAPLRGLLASVTAYACHQKHSSKQTHQYSWLAGADPDWPSFSHPHEPTVIFIN